MPTGKHITKAQLDDIIKRISEGASVTETAKLLGLQRENLTRRLSRDDVKDKYHAAQLQRWERKADEIKDIIRECHSKISKPDVDPKSKMAIVQAYRLEVDTLKWQLSHMLPAVYNDKRTVTHEVGPQLQRTIHFPQKKAIGAGVEAQQLPRAEKNDTNDAQTAEQGEKSE